jgi:hypothetical protein
MKLAKIQTATISAYLMSLLACTADVPKDISFQQHVMPILAANCVRCHSFPTLGGAPNYFRLDVFGDVVVRDGRPRTAAEGPCGLTPIEAQGVICGAVSSAGISASRAGSDKRPMPPRFRIEDHQIEILDLWAQSPERGSPRIDNHAPTASIVQLAGAVTQLTVTIVDVDSDLVVGELWVAVGGTDRFIGPVRSGTQTIDWLTTGIPSGTYQVTARIDDGERVHQVPAGQISIGGL